MCKQRKKLLAFMFENLYQTIELFFDFWFRKDLIAKVHEQHSCQSCFFSLLCGKEQVVWPPEKPNTSINHAGQPLLLPKQKGCHLIISEMTKAGKAKVKPISEAKVLNSLRLDTNFENCSLYPWQKANTSMYWTSDCNTQFLEMLCWNLKTPRPYLKQNSGIRVIFNRQYLRYVIFIPISMHFSLRISLNGSQPGINSWFSQVYCMFPWFSIPFLPCSLVDSKTVPQFSLPYLFPMPHFTFCIYLL